ncbi:unnamed protein product [Paramecium octaurelia]|uniref:Serine/threonine specific protein phosphatases domain-containing protein n=1 Tax=Paramecium octaurelia TaxID=43137 RepID=A0A8S1UD25_PAROT|nr:unnamed protein product [Paramecium octaurelia]
MEVSLQIQKRQRGSLEDIKKIDRYHEPPRSGLFCDILWSDPVDNDQGSLENGWKGNEVRGCSWFFGVEAVHRFLQRNNLISVIRAHEAQLEGYKMHRWKGSQDFPVVITIFSAPNYCDVYKNKGAVIKFENNTLNIQQFKDTPHPYLLPNFMDVFSWSIPFVTEKVTEMLYMLLKHEDQDQESENDIINQQDIEKFKQITQSEQSKTYEKNKSLQKQLSRSGKEKLRSRLKFVATMMKMQKTLREENESIVQLKGACPDKRLPKGLLLQGKEAITDEFNYMKLADSINEKMPNIQIPQQSIQIKKPGQSSKKK